MRLSALLLFWLPLAAAGIETATFRLDRPAEVVARLRLRSPGSDWAQPGREAAVAAIRLDDAAPHYLTLYAGPREHTYSVFLGPVAPGEHRLHVERDPQWSARGSGFEWLSAEFRTYPPDDPDYLFIAHAPILHARQDTLGRFSDVPLHAYCERLRENGRTVLQYTVIFSNEDGGTSTRALMARWGRTADIEYVYRVELTPAGAPGRATIQTRDHKDVEFDGEHVGWHPVLYVVTRNNMVAAHGPATLPYRLAPELADLGGASREKVMDELPILYEVAARELEREGKLRPFGVVDGEKISDPRNYLYVEMKLANRNSAVAVLVRLQGEDRWRSSHLGRSDYAIPRDGWVRTTIELPPGVEPARLAEIGLHCLVVPTRINGKDLWPEAGHCRIEALGRVFLLGRDYRPGPDLSRIGSSTLPLEIPSGELRVLYR